MLEDAKLSRRFWENAVHTASYIYNRVPHQSINNAIPFEKLTKHKIDYNNIRVFGCKVQYFIPRHLRHKFENTTADGIFIGYCRNPTAFKIFDINKNKVVISRVVEFLKMNLEIFSSTNKFKS